MLILALDTSAATGSAALVADGAVVLERAGDGSRTHGERLPRELMALLADARATLDDVDAFAVATGPGSFTGLRIGIAAIQGLALAKGKLVTPVSSFEALAFTAAASVTAPAAGAAASAAMPAAVWIDAHRGEVFAALYGPDGRTVLESPTALSPEATLEAWAHTLGEAAAVRFAGGGALKYRAVIEAGLGARAELPAGVPSLAGAVGRLAAREPERAGPPHAVVPLYVRRPDAELARDRRGIPGGA